MLGAVVEGVPAGLALAEDDLAVDLARRQRGYGRGARQAIEQDRARILGGVRHGLTLGSPILLEVENRDWANWTRVMQVGPLSDTDAAELAELAAEGNKRAQPITRVRPGHADLAGSLKYGFNDVRNALERSSARETAARVAAGGVARAFLHALGIDVWSFTAEVGGVGVDPARCTRSREEADASPLRCPDPDAEVAMIARIDEARSAGDTVGGVFEVVVHGAPIGLGSYVHWDRRLDGGTRRGRDEHQHRQGRGVRPRVRADPAVRVTRARRDRGTPRGWLLDPPQQQRRGPHGRRHQRRADRDPRRGQAHLDAGQAARDRRSRHRQRGREGALRAVGHLRGARCGRHRRGDGDADPRPVRAREDRRRFDDRGPGQPAPLPGPDRGRSDGTRGGRRLGRTRLGSGTAHRSAPPPARPAPPTRPRTPEGHRWTSCSWASPGPARPRSAVGWPTATARPSSTSTSGSRRRRAGGSRRSSPRTGRRPSAGSSGRPSPSWGRRTRSQASGASSRRVAARSSIPATGGCSTGAGCRSGLTSGRRSWRSGFGGHRTSGP